MPNLSPWLLLAEILSATIFLVGLLLLARIRNPASPHWRTWMKLAAVVGGSILAGVASHAADEARHQLVGLRRREQAIQTLDLLLDDLRDMETGQRGYLLTGKESYLQPYLEATERVQIRLQTLSQQANAGLLAPGGVQVLIDLVQAKSEELRRTIRAYQEKGKEEALAIVQTDEGHMAMARIRLTINQLQGQTSRDIRLTQRRELEALSYVGWASLALAILCGGSFIFLSLTSLRPSPPCPPR